MPKPLPPVVDGPITEISPQVYVDNVLPDATVTVYNDPAATNIVGTAKSTSPGAIWVPLTKPIAAGDPITARQIYTGSSIKVTGLSDPSNVPVPVLPVPNPLPSPAFVSGMCTCMDSVLLDGLIPGTTLTIMMGGATLVNAKVNQTPEWFQLATVPIAAGAILSAWQYVGVNKSPTVPSLPVPVAGPLRSPAITPPLLDCATNLGLSNLVPGADLKVINGGAESFVTNAWDSYNLNGVPPLQLGPLTAQQYFTRCEQIKPGPIAMFTVKKAAPDFPKVAYTPCVDVTQLTVSNLIGGEILTVEVSYSNKGGPVVESLGSQGVSGGTATVNLPKDWYPADAIGAVKLRIEVTLCDVPLPNPGYTEVTVGQTGGPFPAPTLPANLFECARSVQVANAHPGALIQLFSDPGMVPRSDAVVAAAAELVMDLWTPLFTGETLVVQQSGCMANGQSKVVVKAIPRELTPPYFTGPVRPGEDPIPLAGVYAGAQVYLFVNGVLRSHMDGLTENVSIPSGSPSLAVGDKLGVIQALCAGISAAGTAVVTPAPVRPCPPANLQPKNGAAFVSPDAYLSFQDPCAGTPAAATEALFLVSQGGVIIGPYSSAFMTSPPFGTPPGYKWPVKMPNGIIEFSVWFKNSAGTGPETDVFFTVGGPPLTPTLTAAPKVSGDNFEVEGGGFSAGGSITIYVNGVLSSVPPVTFPALASGGGDLNQEIDCGPICSMVGAGQLQIWAVDMKSGMMTNTLLVNC
jgi:hypothetical protein